MGMDDESLDRAKIDRTCELPWVALGSGRGARVGVTMVALFMVIIGGCTDRAGMEESGSARGDEQESIVVFAAASAGDVIRDIAARYEKAHPVSVRTSFAATSTLAKQIVAGASPDVFLSASPRWMDFVAQKDRIQVETRRDLLGNEMVLIAPAGERFSVTVSRDFSIGEAFSGRFAIANPDHVPAGRYGRAVLEDLGWWAALEGRALNALDVRMALRLVERGEAGAGIVYRTDAMASEGVTIVGEFPSNYQPEVRYPVALGREASSEGAAFLEFLSDPWSRRRFQEAGFHVVPRNVSVTNGGSRP